MKNLIRISAENLKKVEELLQREGITYETVESAQDAVLRETIQSFFDENKEDILDAYAIFTGYDIESGQIYFEGVNDMEGDITIEAFQRDLTKEILEGFAMSDNLFPVEEDVREIYRQVLDNGM